MRYFGIIVLILIIALGGLPYYFGMRAENEYKNILKISKQHPNIRILNTEYKRGWLSSNAKTEYVVNQLNLDLVRISEQDTIYHGPIPLGLIMKGNMEFKPVMAVIDSSAKMSVPEDPGFNELARILDVLNIKTVISMDGGAQSLINLPSVTSEGSETRKEIERFVWKGLKGNIDFSPDFKHTISKISSPGFLLQGDGVIISVSGITFNMDKLYAEGTYNLPIGNISINIKEIYIDIAEESDKKTRWLSLNNIELNSSITEEGEILNFVSRVGFEEMSISEISYGPALLEMVMGNIDKAAWSKYKEAKYENRTNPSEADPKALTVEFIKLLPDIVKHSPKIEITKLNLSSDKGEIEGHAIFEIDGSSAEENPDLAASPLFLITALSASAELYIEDDLMRIILGGFNEESHDDKEIDRSIENLVINNYFIAEGGGYLFEAAYFMGNLSVNGEPVDIGSLLMGTQ